jgi:hypothetical protein
LKETLSYISERCREECDEANGLKSNYDEERDWYNEAMASFFEKMADIIEEAVSEIE